MKYLKFFEGKAEDARKMAEVIFRYFKEFGQDEDNFYLLDDILSGYVDEDILRFDHVGELTVDQLEEAINLIIKSPPTFSNIKFMETYEAIRDLLDSTIDIEDIDDLFLSCEYKYTIQKGNIYDRPEFKVKIRDVDKVDSIILNLWNVIVKRLPEGYFIKKTTISAGNFGGSPSRSFEFENKNHSIEILIWGPLYDDYGAAL